MDDLKKETLETIKKIENTKEFPYNKSILCNWCEFKDLCPAWGNSPEGAKRRQPKKNEEVPKKKPPIKKEKTDMDKYPTISKYFRD